MAIDPNDIELSPEMKQALAEKAEQTGKPWTEILWEGVKGIIPRKPAESETQSFYDAMMADEAIGVVKEDLPATPEAPEVVTDNSLYDVLFERGMLGCSEGPTDLATNPKHMEGFGQNAWSDSD